MIYKDLKSLYEALDAAGDNPDPKLLADLKATVRKLTGDHWHTQTSGVFVTVADDDMRLLRAMAATAGMTPEELASRYLAGRINVEARQLMGGS